MYAAHIQGIGVSQQVVTESIVFCDDTEPRLLLAKIRTIYQLSQNVVPKKYIDKSRLLW